MQLVFTPIHQTGNTVIKPQAPRPHPLFRGYIRNKHKYCIMSVQNISQHFRLTCRLKGPFEADFQWFNLYLFLLSCLMPLFQWRRSSNSANYRHKLSSRGAWVVHTPPPPTEQSLMNPFSKSILTAACPQYQMLQTCWQSRWERNTDRIFMWWSIRLQRDKTTFPDRNNHF